MSEFIYKHVPSNADATGNPVEAPTLVQREEIVRCRECVHFDAKRDGCWWFSHVERQSDYSWADEPSDVEPDGFCAWGERRNDV